MTKKTIVAPITGLFATQVNAQLSDAQHSKTMKQEKNTFINPAGLFNPMFNGFSHIGQVPAGTDLYFAKAPGCLIEAETIATK